MLLRNGGLRLLLLRQHLFHVLLRVRRILHHLLLHPRGDRHRVGAESFVRFLIDGAVDVVLPVVVGLHRVERRLAFRVHWSWLE